MIKSSPETKINADWLKEELISCLGTLSKPGFNFRGIVCDNYPPNVSNFKNLLQDFNQDPDELFIWFDRRKIYLFYDAAHLMKNIRNNLLNYKRFIFPSFKFDGFKDPINVPGGEMKWKFFFMTFTRKILSFRSQFEKSSKANNEDTTPRKLQTKHSDNTCNI